MFVLLHTSLLKYLSKCVKLTSAPPQNSFDLNKSRSVPGWLKLITQEVKVTQGQRWRRPKLKHSVPIALNSATFYNSQSFFFPVSNKNLFSSTGPEPSYVLTMNCFVTNLDLLVDLFIFLLTLTTSNQILQFYNFNLFYI